ncbi:Rieske 2Fe-2S domain-containing protein [Natronomonas gomsonensis]|uniref:Rieske 2Fe-2S domain-containing protein n=1 Tax=Natronomonas gomsonensis TaxID=1046043 RepID=UPI0037427D92
MPGDTTYVFALEVVDSGEEKEAILLRDDDSIHGWLNYCQHYTHIKLDKGPGAEMRDGELVCTNHAAYFEQDTTTPRPRTSSATCGARYCRHFVQ